MLTAGDPQQLIADRASLRPGVQRAAARGGTVTLAAQAVRVLVTVATIAVMARMLAPADYGRFGLVAALTGMMAVFRDLGLTTATITSPQVTQGQVSALFWINTGLGAALMLAGLALAPALGWFYADAGLVPLAMVIAAAFPIGACGLQHAALLRRQMRFRRLAAVDLASLGVGSAVGIATAWQGAGVWALAWMAIASDLANLALLWLASGWRPGWWAAWREVRPLVAFGAQLQLAALCNALANLDKLIIGAACGPVDLGLYARAQALLTLPVQQVMTPLGNVALPAFSILADDPLRYRALFLATLRVVALGSAYGSLALIACAEPLVLLVLGDRWLGAVDILHALAISVFSFPISSAVGWLFLSQGRGRDLARFSLLNTIVVLAAVAVGIRWGVVGVALAFSLSGLAVRVPALLAMAGSTLVPARALFAAVAPLAVVAALSFAVAWTAIPLLAGRVDDPMARLVLEALLSVAITTLLLAVSPWGRQRLAEGLQYLRRALDRVR